MNKLILLIIAAWLSLGVESVWADISTEPGTMPKQGQFLVGLQGVWIFEQDYKDFNARVSRGKANYWVAVKDTEIKDDRSIMASVAYGVNDRLGIFAKLGLTNGGTFHFSNWEADSSTWWSNKFKLESAFTWALGAKFRLFESRERLGVMLSAEYQRYDDRKTGDMQYPGPGVSLNDFQANYWQADLAATLYKKQDALTFSAGLGYELAELSIAGRANLGTPYANYLDFGDMENADNLAAFVGLGWKATEDVTLNLHGSFLASEAIALGLSWTF